MADITQVKVPDIGDASGVDVIEVLVKVGDTIELEDGLIVLETDKATMEVPSSHAGVVKSIEIKVGDKVSEGDVILSIEAAETSAEADDSAGEESEERQADETEESQDDSKQQTSPQETEEDDSSDDEEQAGEEKEEPLIIPDIGDASGVDVIEVSVQAGDSIEKDDSLIVLETEKATMEVPSPSAGTIVSMSVKAGDKVSQGDQIGVIKTVSSKPSKAKTAEQKSEQSSEPAQDSPKQPDTPKPAPVSDYPVQSPQEGKLVHASPAVRRLAREFGVDLSKVKGTGPKSRVMKEDVQSFIKFELSRPKATASSGAVGTPDLPEIDFSKFGEVEQKPLSRIQKISSVNLHRNWTMIPHVTQHEDADITELDAFRKSMKDEAAKEGVRLTPLAFIMKALVASLKAFPSFNASLANDGENLILKKYYNIGVAVDTPDGLVVPVIRDVDKKSVYELANELGEMSEKARNKKLGAADMQGGCFTISSLGGIGGTSFTPIVNWPDVAILGLSRNQMKPVWNGKEFEPRMMLPMSLSYDHRVIDGAVAARFIVHLSKMLGDIRRVIL
ncbi:dihydrolipoyllysine-residue acetyltransferase [Kangiella koreensis]|uniref:Acetyltransferase component of pyruvate dehydrogenase complex n=1 Tax=Kangiella koreensis (strain DSM 16069 / JCM 12317 / KCTC 12182 / SW-125) TaxID=523791 RepID=C7RA14_KANKD|nr:dihydrolipoyllysine-residue acetyltransferase [Kangiella koreensis]ACV26133.1 pyruvate dehydrogenase complex dihydrolipoamide acetyltransferase [Kangiella koreensis DSM 16069]